MPSIFGMGELHTQLFRSSTMPGWRIPYQKANV